MTNSKVDGQVTAYQERKGAQVESCLGVGTQGSVFLFSLPSPDQNGFIQIAVKFHDREIAYSRELRVFLQLQDLGISEVRGHMVPQLVGYDDELLAIEMTIVSPPYCLDFGGAYLDQRPDYTPEVWADWRDQKSEAFEENWREVQNILAEFETFGVFIADVNPGNIKF